MQHKMSDALTSQREGGALSAGTAHTALLLGVAGSAWLVSARLAMPGMRLGVLTRAQVVPMSSQMGMSGSMSMGLSAFLTTWTVMMVAMMVPSLLPSVRMFHASAGATEQTSSAPLLFTLGYLLVWSAIGGLAYFVVLDLQDWLPAGSVTALRLGAVLLVVAGLYQLTPIKQACLRHCRSPHRSMAPPIASRISGYLGALRAGLWQGVYCLGSSWPLMLVLLLVGMMNLVWMGVIAGLILVEKAMPGGARISKGLGCALAGCGVILLTAPHTVPALGGG